MTLNANFYYVFSMQWLGGTLSRCHRNDSQTTKRRTYWGLFVFESLRWRTVEINLVWGKIIQVWNIDWIFSSNKTFWTTVNVFLSNSFVVYVKHCYRYVICSVNCAWKQRCAWIILVDKKIDKHWVYIDCNRKIYRFYHRIHCHITASLWVLR